MRFVFSRHADKEIAKLEKSDPVIAKRLNNGIKTLADDPAPPGSKAIQGAPGFWRIVVGDYRVIYSLPDSDTVQVETVSHRRDVYEKHKRRTG